MKRLFFILAALLYILPGLSEERKTGFVKEHLNVSVHSRYQLMLNTHGIYNDMLNSYGSVLAGVQVGFDTHQSDNNWWANAYNYPSLSLGFSYDGVGSMNMKPGSNLGDFYNLYLAAEFDFFRAGIFSLGPVLELGISYTSDKYNPRRNIPNQFIGSNVVANMAGGVEAAVRFHPHWEFALTGYLIHHSNGMTHTPNLGTNQAAAGAKLKYYLAAQQTDKRIQLEKPDFPKGSDGFDF